MSGRKRLLRRILSGRSDADIRFDELRGLLGNLGFAERIRGSHHSFRKEGMVRKITLQLDGSHAKPYQARQVRVIIREYGLNGDF